MRILSLVLVPLVLTGCGLIPERFGGSRGGAAGPEPGTVVPAVTPAPLRPGIARTADQLDTTTAAERAAAQAAPAATRETRLGTTIASLGDPAAPGFWIETPLVDSVRPGRVVNPKTGASVQLELRPAGGGAGAGSRVSLAAMRLLGVALTDLPELQVFSGSAAG